MIFKPTEGASQGPLIKIFLCSIILNFFLLACGVDPSSDSLGSQGAPAEDSAGSLPQQYASFVWQVIRESGRAEKLRGPVAAVSGTAFPIGPNRFVTNFHVLLPLLRQGHVSSVSLRQEGDPSSALTAHRILQISAFHDLALFETEETVEDYFNLEKERPHLNEELFALGYPEGSFREMRVTGRVTDEGHYYIFPVNHFYLSGASGSPVFNRRGLVIGILSQAAENISQALKSNKIQNLIEGNTGYDCSQIPALACAQKEVTALKELAQKGDNQAQYSLARLYDSKLWEAKGDSKKEAFYWMEKAAQGGNFLAQGALAMKLYRGEGADKNRPSSFQWMVKSAKRGNVLAQYYLALMYSEGDDGTPVNLEEAMKWLKKSAVRGYAPAQSLLGRIIYNQAQTLLMNADQAIRESEELDLNVLDAIEKKEEEAVQWLEKSAGQGHPDGQFSLAMARLSKRDLTKEDILFAIPWLKKSAERDHILAQNRLADLYESGHVPVNRSGEEKAIAFYWRSRAAARDHFQAQYNLALFYINRANPTDLETEQGFYWMEQSAKLKYLNAQYSLGRMYFAKEKKTEEDIRRGFYWMTQAAERLPANVIEKRLIIEAQYFLAHQYKERENYDQYIVWLRASAKGGFYYAQYELGEELWAWGDPAKTEEAIYWREKAQESEERDLGH